MMTLSHSLISKIVDVVPLISETPLDKPLDGNLYQKTSFEISKLVTRKYSTSFYTSSRLFHKNIRSHIFNIYGFVRFADEIVDTFHGFDKEKLLEKFEKDYAEAFENGISLNPILHAFQHTVKQFNIPQEYIQAFLHSMKLDLSKTTYTTRSELEQYIYGSADVVGLMCLKVFCNGNNQLFEKLKLHAVKLGSAFQKVNFLRDTKADTETLGRYYFPDPADKEFTETVKNQIIEDIERDFVTALHGIRLLPENSRLAVYTAYLYYSGLLKKIKKTPASKIISQRIRISNLHKLLLMFKAYLHFKLNLI